MLTQRQGFRPIEPLVRQVFQHPARKIGQRAVQVAEQHRLARLQLVVFLFEAYLDHPALLFHRLQHVLVVEAELLPQREEVLGDVGQLGGQVGAHRWPEAHVLPVHVDIDLSDQLVHLFQQAGGIGVQPVAILYDGTRANELVEALLSVPDALEPISTL
jgi:hypothetical protein